VSEKLLIYLDQSLVSTMAKQREGQVRPQNAEAGAIAGTLFRLLWRLVDADRVVCPRSTVHDQETDLDSRISDAVYRVIYELSGDAEFITYTEIAYGQVERALRRYVGVPTDNEGDWRHAFTRNPHRPLRRPRLYSRLQAPGEWIEEDRAVRERVRAFRQDRAGERNRSRRGTFAEYRAAEFAGVVRWNFSTPPAGAMPEHGLRLAFAHAELVGSMDEAAAQSYAGFFASPKFRGVPFYDILCSLNAGFSYYQPTRRPRASDLFDFMALAQAMPYVDIVTTDQQMKAMAVQLGLDKRYGVVVYSSAMEDVRALTDRLSQLA
jgi:hypothetical protein